MAAMDSHPGWSDTTSIEKPLEGFHMEQDDLLEYELTTEHLGLRYMVISSQATTA
jgi:hypothetical protein